MIKTYSLKTDGEKQLSSNFKVREFKCSDGSDKILISDELVTVLQKIREHFNKPVTINSAYRTEDYNKKIGGTKASKHILGIAADIKVADTEPLTVALYAQSIGVGGIGLYSYKEGGFTHIDVRSKKSRWVQTERDGKYSVITGIMPTVKKGINGKPVLVLQRTLTALGYACVCDGKFGEMTAVALKKYQKEHRLNADGIAGGKTWNTLAAESK